MSEFLRNNYRNLLATGALVGSLLVGACSAGDSEPSPEEAANKAKQEERDQLYERLENLGYDEPIILPDGRRITKEMSATGKYSRSVYIVEDCNDTRDLTKIANQTQYSDGSGPMALAMETMPDHKWCEDGKITEADFPS